MKKELLSCFFKNIQNCACIGPTHIALYMALYQRCQEENENNTITFYRAELMKMCKLAGKATYHKIINDLVSCGYITYRPRYNRQKSSISLVLMN